MWGHYLLFTAYTQVSTLNVWGNRSDRDLPIGRLATLLAPSFVPSEEIPTPLDENQRSYLPSNLLSSYLLTSYLLVTTGSTRTRGPACLVTTCFMACTMYD